MSRPPPTYVGLRPAVRFLALAVRSQFVFSFLLLWVVVLGTGSPTIWTYFRICVCGCVCFCRHRNGFHYIMDAVSRPSPAYREGLILPPAGRRPFSNQTALHVFVSFRGRGHGGLAPLATDLVACVAFAVLPSRAVGSHAKETLRGGFEAVVSISLLSYLVGPDTAQIR